MFQSRLIPFLRRIVMPVKIVWVGHIYWAVYSAVVLGGGLWLSWKALRAAFSALNSEAYRLELLNRYLYQVQLGVTIVVALLFLPFVLTVVTLPVRVVWFEHRLALSELISATPRSLLACLQTIPQAVKYSFKDLIPGFAMALLYYLFVRGLTSENIFYLYTTACIVVSVLACYRALPVLVAPILSVAAAAMPLQAVTNAAPLLRAKRPALTLCLALGAGGISLVLQFAHGIAAIACVGIVVWYCTTLIALLCMEAMSEWVALQQSVVSPGQPSYAPDPHQPAVLVRRVQVR